MDNDTTTVSQEQDFSATEIERQATAIDDQVTNLKHTLSWASERFQVFAKMFGTKDLSSSDSQMKQQLLDLADTFDALAEKAPAKYIELAEIMHDYASKTIETETNAAQQVAQTTSSLQDINDLISNI